MFQSRNRETYDSNGDHEHPINFNCSLFQSRNRETYDSNFSFIPNTKAISSFQSRNRETYDSNTTGSSPLPGGPDTGFNLVIEKLMIPTKRKFNRQAKLATLFQSRNRETYDSNNTTMFMHETDFDSFNLVIEKLMIPTAILISPQFLHKAFQSRNRETYDSNSAIENFWQGGDAQFQSRNRETYDSQHSKRAKEAYTRAHSFNLVIEKLMIPTYMERIPCCKVPYLSFNLVIEKLMIPTIS